MEFGLCAKLLKHNNVVTYGLLTGAEIGILNNPEQHCERHNRHHLTPNTVLN